MNKIASINDARVRAEVKN